MYENAEIDQHIPQLIKLDPSTDLHENEFILNNSIVMQDKASCFPPFILNSAMINPNTPLEPKTIEFGSVIDCCAAPGNKTSYMSNLIGPKYLYFHC